MQRILESVKQAFRKSILILALMSLISLSSLFIFATQPSLAATPTFQKPIQQQNIDIDSQNSREQAYEEQVKAAENPEKVYEENLKDFKKENPDESLVEKTVEKAEKLVGKVTGKESVPVLGTQRGVASLKKTNLWHGITGYA